MKIEKGEYYHYNNYNVACKVLRVGKDYIRIVMIFPDKIKSTPLNWQGKKLFRKFWKHIQKLKAKLLYED